MLLLNRILAVVLCVYAAVEINYPQLSPQSQLAIFALLGLVACFLNIPAHPRLKDQRAARVLDVLLALGTVVVCAYVVVQTEPMFESLWIGGQSLGGRAGQEAGTDIWLGAIGLLLVLEATRRSIGWALPILAIVFVVYAFVGPWLPDALFPHRGYGVNRVVSQTFVQSQGVFGTALRVMFTYVFLFVVFGAFLRQTGATQYIVDFAQRVFRGSPGGAAKVSVLSSGLMGSLSGSAVANTATTGTFTIPMMRSAGFKPEVAAGVEAAASSGGALVPPVMGAGAYMMLEIIDPPVTYLQVIRAALIPAVLYYLSLLLIVHFFARRIGAKKGASDAAEIAVLRFEGLIFTSGIFGLIVLLLSGYTVFRAVSIAIVVVVAAALFHHRTRLTWASTLQAFQQSARDVVPLISAAACVGIIIGVVTLTGVGTKLPAAILRLAEGSLISALVLIMISSIVLGMGLPSAVCYLLMATLVGPVLSELGVVPLSAHLFIFYFGMMSMVTPPVALAAYTASSIAKSKLMQTGFAAFRFALVGFTLPFLFVLRPQLLMLEPSGESAAWTAIVGAAAVAVAGIVPFAASIAGYLFGPLPMAQRVLLFSAALLLLFPQKKSLIAGLSLINVVGLLLLLGIAVLNWREASQAG